MKLLKKLIRKLRCRFGGHPVVETARASILIHYYYPQCERHFCGNSEDGIKLLPWELIEGEYKMLERFK